MVLAPKMPVLKAANATAYLSVFLNKHCNSLSRLGQKYSGFILWKRVQRFAGPWIINHYR